MWLVGSKPIRSNVTMPTTSFLHVLCHSKFVMIRVKEHFLHTRRHVPCVMTSSVIPSLSIFNIWRRGGFRQLCHYREYINPPHQGAIAQNNYVVQWYIILILHQHTNSRGHREYKLTIRWWHLQCRGKRSTKLKQKIMHFNNTFFRLNGWF